MSDTMRMLVVGLDGVCQDVLDPLIANDVVPNLERIGRDSAVGPLRSQLPPWTPSAWPSLYTGVNPGKHGVFDFLRFDGYDWNVVNRSHVKEYAVWELLSMHGFSSVVLNVPGTHPPREFDGVLVPGYLAPEAPECHPTGVWEHLERELGEYTLYADTLSSVSSNETMASDLVRLTRMRGEAFRLLVDEHDPDFGFVQFQGTDTVYHEFPDDEEFIREVYGAVDSEVGKIIEACDPDVLLVVSDHGLGPIEGYEFRVNDYLRRTGYVNTTSEGSGMPSWKSITRQQHGRTRTTTGITSLAETALEHAARVGVTSQRIGAMLERVGIDDWILKRVPVDLVRAGTKQVDFPTSTAYMRARTEMGIRINLVGREPDGIVSTDEYEQVRSDLIDLLERVRTPEGERVFEAVYRREDVFDGPYVEDAPDLLTVPNAFDHFLVGTLKGESFGEPTEPWEHKRDGIVMATGNGVDPTTDLSGAHLFDITPTILSVFGIPVGERMDGYPLPIIDSTERSTLPSFEAPEAVVTNGSDVMDRLQNLGYLE